MPLHKGQAVAHYVLADKLGEGGMGIVYKAHDTRLDRDVALKFLAPELIRDPDAKHRFINEAKAASALQHENICVIHDIGETDDGQLFICMEYYAGRTVRALIQRRDTAITRALTIAARVAHGLAAAHAHGIIHRDVKPENILLTDDHRVILMDFGLAKLKGGSLLTKSQVRMGTAGYMSPEQVQSTEVDQRTDIFSLGAVLYELVTAHRPFRGEHEAAMLYSLVNESPEPLATYLREVPEGLQEILDTALAKEKAERFGSAGEMAAELQRVEQRISPHTAAPRRPSRVPWLIAGAAAIVAALGGLLFSPSRGPSLPEGKSIAVLPFQNLSDSKEDEYFSEGITDDIIVQLSKIAGVKVLSRTSTMKYRQSEKGPREIGEELDVATVLQGSVRRAGDHVRVVAQLIDARDEGHLWAETYDKDLDQIFAVQSDLAQRIAAALRVRLSAEEKARIQRKPTEKPEAYEHYLKGRFYWNKRSDEGMKKALQYFREALDVDSLYAQAHAGVADCYLFLDPSVVGGRGATYRDTYAAAKGAAMRALAIDSTLPEAHTSLAFMLERRELAWADAEAHYLQAIALDPRYPTAHQWYGLHLILRGRTEQGIAEVQHALTLDPVSLMINADLGLAYYWARRYDDGIAQLQKTLELDSTYVLTHGFLGNCYAAKGWKDKAVRAYLKGSELDRIDPVTIARRRGAFTKDGWRGFYQERLREELGGGSLDPHTCAHFYMRLDDPENAISMLERAFREGGRGRYDLGCSFIWDPLRSDQRFIALLKRAGFQS